jgi:hypothetical protein
MTTIRTGAGRLTMGASRILEVSAAADHDRLRAAGWTGQGRRQHGLRNAGSALRLVRLARHRNLGLAPLNEAADRSRGRLRSVRVEMIRRRR